MQLLPPSEGLHCSIELLIRSVNEHAGPQGYAVTKKRSKKSKKGVTMKVWLCCDRAGVPKARGAGHRFQRLSLNKPLGAVEDAVEDEDEDEDEDEVRQEVKQEVGQEVKQEVEQEVKQEVNKLQAFQTA